MSKLADKLEFDLADIEKELEKAMKKVPRLTGKDGKIILDRKNSFHRKIYGKE